MSQCLVIIFPHLVPLTLKDHHSPPLLLPSTSSVAALPGILRGPPNSPLSIDLPLTGLSSLLGWAVFLPVPTHIPDHIGNLLLLLNPFSTAPLPLVATSQPLAWQFSNSRVADSVHIEFHLPQVVLKFLQWPTSTRAALA